MYLYDLVTFALGRGTTEAAAHSIMMLTQTPSRVRLDAVTHERFNLHASVHIEARS